MKKSVVLTPAIFIIFLLLNSFFVLKESTAEKGAGKSQAYSDIKPIDKQLIDSFAINSQKKIYENKLGLVNIAFKSTDAGQSWQDISEGLPQNLQQEDVQKGEFFTNENGLYLRAGNGIYHSKPNSTEPYWEREIFPYMHGRIINGNTNIGIFAYNYYDGQLLRKINGTSMWSPIYTSFQEKAVNNIFKTVRGTILISTDKGLFKSTDSGKSWKQVYDHGWVMKLVESNNVLLATCQTGILRSTDNGEKWDLVIAEGGVGISVEAINGGFATISCNTITQSRRIHLSFDGGKTWNAVSEGLLPSLFIPSAQQTAGVYEGLPRAMSISSIKQVGPYLICGHPDGIFRSSDMGKTWQLLLPTIDKKVFGISVSGNVIYAIPRSGGC